MAEKIFNTSATPTVIIEMVGGNLSASGVDRELVTVKGPDSSLVASQDGDEVVLICDSNLDLEVPLSANITIQFVGGNANLKDLSGETVIEFIGGITNMNNVTKVKSSSRGGAKDFGKNFAKGFGKDFNPLPPDFEERIARKVEQATSRVHGVHERVEEAARRAQKHAEQAARRAERQARNASHHVRANVSIGRWKWDSSSQGAPTPPSEPVTDEERMAILRMLQEKKISADEAEKLLSALDGGK